MLPPSVLVSYFYPHLSAFHQLLLTDAVHQRSGVSPFPGCLLCVWVTSCGDNIFYIKKKKKENCGLLGGSTFYRTCLICKSEKKKDKNIQKWTSSLSCTGHVQTQTMYKKDPFCGRCTLPFSYIISFWYMLLGDCFFLVSSGGGLY